MCVALYLYRVIPFGKIHRRNPKIIKLATLLERTPSSLSMKLANFSSIDPDVTSAGKSGLSHASRQDREVWQEMKEDWIGFLKNCNEAEEYLKLIPEDSSQRPQRSVRDLSTSTVAEVNVRKNQGLFREAMINMYSGKCCITGLSEPKLLVASHIKPWHKDLRNRLNPTNGLLLSALHDKAFDRGLITIEEDLSIVVSEHMSDDMYARSSIKSYEGKKITPPSRHPPDPEFLAHHRDKIFESWLRA